MTISEAAAALGLSRHTLDHQVKRGRLRATKHGPIYWVTAAEVARYRRENLGRVGWPMRAPREKLQRAQDGTSESIVPPLDHGTV
jgi:excisionase family DNA binding protein